MDIEINNQKELLRIYKNNSKNAKDAKEKTRWDNSIAKTEAKISKLEAAAAK